MYSVLYPTQDQICKAHIYNNQKMHTFDIDKGQRNDNRGSTRFLNGGIVECAVLESFGFKWNPYTYGSGLINSIPDLTCINLNLGVKSAIPHYSKERNMMECVVKPNIILKSDEIFCNYFPNEQKIILRGICTQEILDRYGDYSLVYGDLRSSGKNKTGFERYDMLLPLPENPYQYYKTAIISKESIYTQNVERNCVYLERISNEYLAYVVVNNGILSERKIIYFHYYKAMSEGLYEKSKNQIFELFDIIAEKKIVFSLGMTNIFYQLKTYNERLGNEKRYFNTYCVDLFNIINKFRPDWGKILDYNACYDYSSSMRKNLGLLINSLKIDVTKYPSQKDYISDNCYYALLCFLHFQNML